MRERKYAKKKSPRRLFLVICEGETERQYIETLKLHYRLPITIKTKVSGTKICKRLVARYLSELGLDKTDSCEVFFVYDADVAEMVDRLTGLCGTLILSNPCIELWFALHAADCRKCRSSREIVADLAVSHKVWANYCKGLLRCEQASFLVEHSADACRRAQKLKWPDNPSTNMHVFIDAVEKARFA